MLFSARRRRKILRARLAYVMENLSKKNNFQTYFLENKIKSKNPGCCYPGFLFNFDFFFSPREPGGYFYGNKKSVKDFSKCILNGKIIFQITIIIYFVRREAPKNFFRKQSILNRNRLITVMKNLSRETIFKRIFSKIK